MKKGMARRAKGKPGSSEAEREKDSGGGRPREKVRARVRERVRGTKGIAMTAECRDTSVGSICVRLFRGPRES